MYWERYSIKTKNEFVDLICAQLIDLGIEGFEIQDNLQISEEDAKGMFIDVLPEVEESDDAVINFYLEPDSKNEDIVLKVKDALNDLSIFTDIGNIDIEKSNTEDKDWINNWKKYFHSFYVDDIFIKPTWEDDEKPEGDSITIEIDPGTAFGTGAHETTQLCIKQLKKYIDIVKKYNDNIKLLDIGTGSGILGIVGIKLGVKEVLATDLDENCIVAVNDNLDKNGIDKKLFNLIIGNVINDINIIDNNKFETFDIVTANIFAPIIVQLMKIMHNFVKINGYFITSGIINDKEQMVLDSIKSNDNFKLVEVNYQGEWVNVTMQRIK